MVGGTPAPGSSGSGHGRAAQLLAVGEADAGLSVGENSGGGGAEPAGRGRGRGAGRGSCGQGGPAALSSIVFGCASTATTTKKTFKKLDMKSFYSGSGSGSGPSTRQSGNVASGEEVQGPADFPTTEPEVAQREPAMPSSHLVEGIRIFEEDIHVISDPALRIPIEAFHPDIRDDVKRAYLLKGPTQFSGETYPRKTPTSRPFLERWFSSFDWLEYSKSKDAAYCFYCSLFKQDPIGEKFGHDVFSKTGYTNWKNACKSFKLHVGGPTSCHNRARAVCDDFKNQRASISRKIVSNSKDAEMRYAVRLTASLDVANFLISQGHAFRGRDESLSSLNKGNFLELIDWYKKRNDNVRIAFDDSCPLTARMTSNKIQKDICSSYAQEVKKAIKEEIGDSYFSVLIDESRDISIAEQMAVIVRFVNKKGMVVERFLGLKHVADTTSNALRLALLEMLESYGLSIARIRGQGYDGASNMRGEFNGLQTQIRSQNPHAFYVHCFAHQLQLVIVSVTSCCSSFSDFFNYVSMIVTSTSASCKRKDVLLAKHRETILRKLESGEIFSGRGKHQSTNLVRAGDTRWGSHFTTLLRMESMWESVVKVLAMIHEDERNPGRATGLLGKMESKIKA